MKSFIILLISTLIFSGCASNFKFSSRHADIVLLEIKQPITVPAGSSYAYVKATGQVVRRNQIGTYELYCKFLVPKSRDSGEAVISPGIFSIHGIHRRSAAHMPGTFGEHQLAFNGRFVPRRGNGGTQVDLELFFNISSPDQPHVKSLSCIRFSEPVLYNYPTVEEVKDLFGDLAEFRSA